MCNQASTCVLFQLTLSLSLPLCVCVGLTPPWSVYGHGPASFTLSPPVRPPAHTMIAAYARFSLSWDVTCRMQSQARRRRRRTALSIAAVIYRERRHLLMASKQTFCSDAWLATPSVRQPDGLIGNTSSELTPKKDGKKRVDLFFDLFQTFERNNLIESQNVVVEWQFLCRPSSPSRCSHSRQIEFAKLKDLVLIR